MSDLLPVCVNFSGGRTSAFMCKLMLEDENYRKRKLLFIYANTGKEREETLEFCDQCDKHFGLNLVWVEAKVNPILGEGTTYTKVDYASASRDGKPFEEPFSNPMRMVSGKVISG